MKVTVIYNPTAGGGREALLCRFVAELERQGASVRLYYTCLLYTSPSPRDRG